MNAVPANALIHAGGPLSPRQPGKHGFSVPMDSGVPVSGGNAVASHSRRPMLGAGFRMRSESAGSRPRPRTSPISELAMSMGTGAAINIAEVRSQLLRSANTFQAGGSEQLAARPATSGGARQISPTRQMRPYGGAKGATIRDLTQQPSWRRSVDG